MNKQFDSNKSSEKYFQDDIAIIGLSARVGKANSPQEFWNNMEQGVDCLIDFPKERQKKIAYIRELIQSDIIGKDYCKASYLEDIDKFDYKFFNLSPNEARLMDPNQRIFLESAYEALEDAGYGGNKITGTRTGVFLGYKFDEYYDYKKMILDLEPESLLSSFNGNLTAITPSRLSYMLDLKGPSLLVETACSSSLVALHLACQSIRSKESEMALVAGLKISLVPLETDEKLGIESSDGRTRTFDNESTGTGMGEGVIAILIKPLKKALKDGDNIHAVIKGSAINQDGHSVGLTAPNVLAQSEVIDRAWQDAGINPETIGYIETHGTGTKIGDPIEIEGIQKAFEKYTNKKQFCAVSSIKSNLGHLDNAAGMAGLLQAIMALKNKKIPPVFHFNLPNSRISFTESPVYVNKQLSDWVAEGHPRRCGISSFGFSGTNCHVILEEAPEKIINNEQNDINVFTVSAKSDLAFRNLLKMYSMLFTEQEKVNVSDLCFTSSTGRGHYQYRLAILCQTYEDLKSKFLSIDFSNLEINIEKGIFYGFHEIGSEEKKKNNINVITEVDSKNIGKAANELLKREYHDTLERYQLMTEVCKGYIAGGEVNWEYMYVGQKRYKLSLPIYNFDKKSCWLKVPDKDTEKEIKCFKSQWIQQKSSNNNKKNIRNLLVFSENEDKLFTYVSILKEMGHNVISTVINNKLKTKQNLYKVTHQEEDFSHLFLEKEITKIDTIIYLTDEAKVVKECTLEALIHINKGLKNNSDINKLDFYIVNSLSNKVDGSESVLIPENAMIYGLVKALWWENPSISYHCIDVDMKTDIKLILTEVESNDKEFIVAYRNNKRFVERISRDELVRNQSFDSILKSEGVYIIAGGLGGISSELCKYMASFKQINLGLLTLKAIPPKEAWDEILLLGKDKALCEKLRCIIELEEQGTIVECISVDVCNAVLMEDTINYLVNKYKAINGVIQCAGISDGAIIAEESIESIKHVLNPKVSGTRILDAVTRPYHPEFFVLCSSAITLTGKVGGGAYTAANSFLDAFAEYRNLEEGGTLVINWPSWKDVGMLKGKDINEEKELFHTIKANQGVAIFEDMVCNKKGRVIVGNLNKSGSAYTMLEYFPFQFETEIISEINAVTKNISRNKKTGEQYEDVRLLGRTAGNYTHIERIAGNIWGKCLGLQEIDIFDDYYALGGDSIIALKIINAMNDSVKTDIKLVELLKNPTIHSFSMLFNKDLIENDEKLELANGNEVIQIETYPASSAQKRMFIMNQLSHIGTAYNLPVAFRMKGGLNKARFEATINQLMTLHPVLRTEFYIDNDCLMQKIHSTEVAVIAFETSTEKHIKDNIQKFIKPFDLSTAPLFRCGVWELNSDDFIIVFDMHHIISDGISIRILTSDFIRLYGGDSLEKNEIDYLSYVDWQNDFKKSESYKIQEDYWLEMMKGELPVLNLPLDYQRPKCQSYVGSHVYLELDEELSNQIHLLASKKEVTLYMLLLSAYYVLLAKYSGQDDIIVGTPIAGRPESKFANVVGLFVNTVAIRQHPNSDKTFSGFLREVKDMILKCFENQEYPFEELVNQLGVAGTTDRNPIFDTMFVLQNAVEFVYSIGDLEICPVDYVNNTSKFDLTVEAKVENSQIKFDIEYCTDLFTRESMEIFAEHFKNILEFIVLDDTVMISEIQMLSLTEKEKILYEFNSTYSEYPENQTILDLFLEQVKRNPDAPAIRYGENEIINYAQLNNMVNQLGRHLRTLGGGKETVTGVCMKRSPYMIVALLSILKAGGAYLPIDPSVPAERLKYILKDSKARCLITDKVFDIRSDSIALDIVNILEFDFSIEQCEDIEVINSPSDLMYVIYTSGSTGNPKGAMLEHGSVLNRLYWMQKQYPLSSDDIILQKTTYTFDVSVWELFLGILSGASCYIVEDGVEKDPEAIIETISNNGITVLHFVPTMLNVVLNYIGNHSNCIEKVISLRHIFASGEALTPEIVKSFYNLGLNHMGIKLTNLYGPTEAAVDVSYYDCLNVDPKRIPIGRPIDNIKLYVLDNDLRIQPIGVSGELYISGIGVGRGYINNPKLTAERFLIDTYCSTEDAGKHVPKMYKTGDIARWTPDGEIIYEGRSDNQVKIRGFRIELDEIENIILSFPGILNAAVIVTEDQYMNKYISAYITSEMKPDDEEIKHHLKSYLPSYMLPSKYIWLKKLPLLQSGKIDRKALVGIQPQTLDVQIETKMLTEMEAKLINIWGEVLNLSSVDINKSFFDLGGHSILAIKLEEELNKQGMNITYRDIYEYKNITELAKYIEYQNRARINQYTLEGVEPFNELFYYSCFYNSFFPIVRYFQKDILPFIINSIPVYMTKEKENYLIPAISYEPQHNFSLLKEECIRQNIQVEASTQVESIDWVKKNLNEGKFVIAFVDCFYESLRTDVYLKQHIPHALLLYGYDDELQEYAILEHTNQEVLDYRPMKIGYQDFKLASEGFKEYFEEEMPIPALTSYKVNSCSGTEKSQNQLKIRYAEKCKQIWPDMCRGFENIELFAQNALKENQNGEGYFTKILEDIIPCLNQIINAKKAELYMIENLHYTSNKFFEGKESILIKWEDFRAALYRFYLNKNYRKNSIEKLLVSLLDELASEKKSYEELILSLKI